MTFKRWFKLPDRIAARIALTILLALLATQSVNLLLFLAFRPPPPQAFSGHWLTDRVKEAATEVFSAAPEARPQRITMLNHQTWLRFAWSAMPPVLPEEDAGPPFSALQSLLEDGAYDRDGGGASEAMFQILAEAERLSTPR